MFRPCSVSTRKISGDAGPKLRQSFLRSDTALVEADAEAREQPSRQVLQPPAHHAVPLQVRPFLDDSRERLPLGRVELEPRAGLLALDQAVRPGRVEGQHPVAHRRQADRADPRGLRPAPTLVDRGQREKPPALTGIAALPRQTSQGIRIQILAQIHGLRHGKPPSLPLRITSASSA